MKLLTNWDDFSLQIEQFVISGKAILAKENTIAEGDLDAVKNEMKALNEQCIGYLESSIEEKDFAHEYTSAKFDRYNFGNNRKDFKQIKKEAFEDFQAKIRFLEYNKKLFNTYDVITKPQIIDLDRRKNFTTEEKLELILDKLFDLYDNYFHPIEPILGGNGIFIQRHGEEREFGKLLEDAGYVELNHSRITSARLTLQGKMHVEEKRKTFQEDYSDITASREEINARVDEVIEKLNVLGDGHQIIYDELQELKELYTKLSKKDWGQIVKGKIVDLALAKLIENDTLKFIYEKLTDHTLRLP